MPNATTDPTVVDTKRVTIRRLNFTRLEQAIAEAERIAAADAKGLVRPTGNWSPGKSFGHLAWWIDGAFDGISLRPPWLIRAMGPFIKGRVLRGPLIKGLRIGGVPEGTLGVEELSTAEGLQRFQRAAARLIAACPQRPNPVFGVMTHDEWLRLHMRHAEHHLGFLVIEGDSVG